MAGPRFLVAKRRTRSGRLFLDDGFLVRRLHAATRALGERRLDLLDRLGLGDALHRRDLARQPVERGFIELPLAVGLLRLGLGPVEVAHHLRDRDDIAGIDLGFVFLRPARPYGALDARTALERLERTLDDRAFGELAHADRRDLRGGNPTRHLVLQELDDEQLQLAARDLLLLDRHDLAHAVGRIDDEFIGLEALSLGGLLGDCHSLSHSFALRPDAAGRLRCGGCTSGGTARGLRGPPGGGGGLFGGGVLRLRPMTRFCCLSFRVDLTPLYDGSSGTHRKNMLPGGSFGCGVYSLWYVYNTFSAGIKALRRYKEVFLARFCG